MEITVENFSYSSVKEWIKDYNHQDKVRCAIYSAELVIDIYERNHDSKAPRLAIEAAKAWVESPTEYNRKAACDAADRAYAAVYATRFDLYVVFAAAEAAEAAAEAAVYTAVSSTRDDDYANSAAAEAVEAAAEAGGKNVKAKIISWFRKSDKKEDKECDYSYQITCDGEVVFDGTLTEEQANYDEVWINIAVGSRRVLQNRYDKPLGIQLVSKYKE